MTQSGVTKVPGIYTLNMVMASKELKVARYN